MVSVQESWKNIVDWFEEREPNAVNHLNPGALPHQFKALEAEIPNLPPEFYDLYRLNDGQEYQPDVAGILLGLKMLSLAEIEMEYKAWKELIEDDPERGEEEGLSIHPVTSKRITSILDESPSPETQGTISELTWTLVHLGRRVKSSATGPMSRTNT